VDGREGRKSEKGVVFFMSRSGWRGPVERSSLQAGVDASQVHVLGVERNDVAGPVRHGRFLDGGAALDGRRVRRCLPRPETYSMSSLATWPPHLILTISPKSPLLPGHVLCPFIVRRETVAGVSPRL